MRGCIFGWRSPDRSSLRHDRVDDRQLGKAASLDAAPLVITSVRAHDDLTFVNLPIRAANVRSSRRTPTTLTGTRRGRLVTSGKRRRDDPQDSISCAPVRSGAVAQSNPHRFFAPAASRQPCRLRCFRARLEPHRRGSGRTLRQLSRDVSRTAQFQRRTRHSAADYAWHLPYVFTVQRDAILLTWLQRFRSS